ncbi:MAG TPA: exonuclease V subunit gamma, partial [Acinetobacter sp.]|nr:exonuclease V subunit gamma [Acinetobacter sp.]
DRSRLEDDQGAFLDALLLAQQSLWLFYKGFDVNDGEMREPSTAVQELVKYLALITQKVDGGEATRPDLQGLEIPAQLHSLYQIHPLQPFDVSGFTQPKPMRFQDHWYRVAQQIAAPTGQRQAWQDTLYMAASNDFVSIQSRQWIQDVCFPARLYLKTLGVENLKPENLPDEVEPLVLDGLGRYAVRNFLQQQGQTTQPELLLDQLPVGKMQQAAWQISVIEQQQLQARLQRYAETVTAVTQQLWNMSANIQFQITVPSQSTQQWVSLEASSARAKRRVQLWLEYLFWLAHENLGDAGQDLTRLVVFSDQTVLCHGVSSHQAQQYLAAWFEMWQHGQMQPVVLPAALLFKVAEKGKQLEWQPDEQGRPQIKDWDSVVKDWQDDGRFAGFSVLENEASAQHRDWQFILQQQDSTALLAQACQQYAYALYAPIFQYQQLIKE